jgi:ankyrin
VHSRTESGYTPLHVASHFGSARVVDLLLQRHAANESMDAASDSIDGSLGEVIETLDDRICAISKEVGGDKAVGVANGGHSKSNRPAEVNAQTSFGYTPLHHAAQQGHDQVVEALLLGKADPNIHSKVVVIVLCRSKYPLYVLL